MDNYSLIVIGAGAAGLVIAVGAAKVGKKVLLIEKGQWGGDCTNFGCVPSKSLIQSAEECHFRKIGTEAKRTDSPKSLDRVRQIVRRIRQEEEPEVLKQKGIDTLTGVASFVSPHELVVQTEQGKSFIRGDRIVLACGSSPYIPEIEGLDQVPYLTNETLFDLEKVPSSLTVVGGGPMGAELAQAFLRLGSHVHLIHKHSHLLDREEQEAKEVIEKVFSEEGMELFLNYQTLSAHVYKGQIRLEIENKKTRETKTIQSEKLLITTGRRPNVRGLALEEAGVDYTDRGVVTDRYGRTSQSHIWAVGDIRGAPFFTHWAESQARDVLTSLLIPWFKQPLDTQALPRVTFTDPEVASCGLLEEEAIDKYGKKALAIYHISFDQVDRAITQGREEGFVKIITKKWSSAILGVTIVGPRAGEMLPEVTLAMYQHIPLRRLRQLIHPYPTYNQAIRKLSDKWLLETILPALTKWFKR